MGDICRRRRKEARKEKRENAHKIKKKGIVFVCLFWREQ